MMNMNENIRKAMTICMAYCMKAIMSPTCMFEAATCLAPTQMIASISTFMISIINGNMMTMTRLTNRPRWSASMLALSKRFSSNFCMLKARTTIMPDRFSRITRLMRSISFWIDPELGHGDREHHDRPC